MTKRIVACGIAVVFIVLVGGGVADAMNSVAAEDMKPGCHTDYYLRVIPVGMYCASIKAP
ncbi:MAG: hypothetical protein WKF95_12775 [Rubrobacter sp.]